MTLEDDKAAVRRAAQARRKVAHAAGQGQQDATDRLATVLNPWRGAVLSGFLPIGTEIDPCPAMMAHDGPVCVPVVTGRGRPLAFRAWHPGVALVDNGFGVKVPADGDWLVPRVLIVPLLAFDRRGYRLGYGGGFYDRTLAGLRAAGEVLAVGFAFAAQELDEVPTGPLDQPLDLIVTETEVVTPGAGFLPG